MKTHKALFALVCVLLLSVTLPAVSLAATVYNDVDTYAEFHAALFDFDKDKVGPGPVIINITGDFEVNRSADEWPALPAGSTINGNGHTLHLKSTYNWGNGGYLYKSMGNTTVNDLTLDATNLTSGGIGLAAADGDKLNNVTIIGASKLLIAVSASGTVTVTNCHFSNVKDGVYNEDSTVVKISGTTFENCSNKATYLRGNGSSFSNNTVTNSDLNIVGTDVTVTGNDFNGDTRIKFYQEAKDFSGNNINDESYIVNEPAAKNGDLSQNNYENIDTALASDTISDAVRNAAKEAQLARLQPAVQGGAASLPQTGDNSSLALWSALMVLSAAAFVATRKARLN